MEYEINCEFCGRTLGIVRENGLIVASKSLGKNRHSLDYLFSNGEMTVRCCGRLRLYIAKDGFYECSTILTKEFVDIATQKSTTK